MRLEIRGFGLLVWLRPSFITMRTNFDPKVGTWYVSTENILPWCLEWAPEINNVRIVSVVRVISIG